MSKLILKYALKMASELLEKTAEKVNSDEYFNKHEMINTSEEDLDLFSTVISKIVSCKQDDLIFQALKIIKLFSDLGVKLKIQDELFFKNVIGILTKTTAVSVDLIQIIFSLLNGPLFDTIHKFSFMDCQIVFHLLSDYLYISDEVNAPLLFLKHLISEKFIKVEIYDMIDKVFEIFYETQSEFFETNSQQLILEFVQNFPIDDVLLVKYTVDLIKHLEVESPFKRVSIIVFLKLLFEKYGLDFCKEFVF